MPGAEEAAGFRLKGWHVLAILLGVFAVVGSVNAYMVYVATTTMRGLDQRNAYERGVGYERDVLAAQAQDGRHWAVDVTLRPGPGPDRAVTISAVDKDNHPLIGMKAKLMLIHPSDARKDRSVALAETKDGIFAGVFTAESGKWYMQLLLDDSEGQTRFRSRNTITLQ